MNILILKTLIFSSNYRNKYDVMILQSSVPTISKKCITTGRKIDRTSKFKRLNVWVSESLQIQNFHKKYMQRQT